MAVTLPRLSPTIWVTAQTIFVQFFGLALFAIQAPLLGPRAFGLVAIVMVFVGFCESVLAEAASEVLISIREVDDLHFQTMTTVTAMISLILGGGVWLGAVALAGLFGDHELTALFRWMAMLPLITSLGAAPNAMAKRDMQFQPLAIRAIAGVAGGGVVGMILTLLGAGVWALVWQAIVQQAIRVGILWLAVPLRFRFTLSRRHFRDILDFAGPLLLSRTMNWMSGQIPRFILGLNLGATELGLFSLASRLNDILMQLTLMPKYAVARVELRQYAGDPRGLDAATRRLMQQMSFLCFPLCIGAWALAPTLFSAWLDPRWYGGIVPAQMMLLMGVPLVTMYGTSALFMALNQQASEAAISTLHTLMAILTALIFAPFGLIIVTAAIAARPLGLVALPAISLRRNCGLSFRATLGAQFPALLAAILMGIVVWFLRLQFEGSFSSLVLLPVLIVLGAVFYVLLTALLLPDFVGRLLKSVSGRFNQRAGPAL